MSTEFSLDRLVDTREHRPDVASEAPPTSLKEQTVSALSATGAFVPSSGVLVGQVEAVVLG